MTRPPYVHGSAGNLTGKRRHLRLIAALAAGFAALTVGPSGAAQQAGVSALTVTVRIADIASPPGRNASRWGRVAAAPQPGAQLLATTEGAGKLRFDPPGAGRRSSTCTDAIAELRSYSGGCAQPYPNGARVTIRAVVDTTVRGARFVGWSDYRCPRNGLTCTLTMRGLHHLTAIFAPVLLKVVEGAFGAIGFTPPSVPCTFVPDPTELARTCKVPYPPNALVTLARRQAAADGSFWGGPCPALAITCTVRMHTNQRVVAGARRVAYQMFGIPGNVGEAIRLEYAGPRGGTIAIRPVTGPGQTKPCRRTCTARFGHGELVEIRAKSGPGARFRRWADSRVRSSVRRVRIGLRNPVRAIFARK